jgi:hypothetical protein
MHQTKRSQVEEYTKQVRLELEKQDFLAHIKVAKKVSQERADSKHIIIYI